MFKLLLRNSDEQSRYENFKVIKNTLPEKSGNPESLEKYSQQFESFSTNVSAVGEDLLRTFFRLFYLQFCDSSDQTLCSIGFTSNLGGIFT